MKIIRAGLRKYIERLPWLFYKFRIIQKISDVAGEKIDSLITWKAGRDEENTFTEDNEFTKPVKVADGVDAGDAVNLEQLDKKADEFDNRDILEGIAGTDISNWDSAFQDSHTHLNKSTLDGITSSLITDWNTSFNRSAVGLSVTGDSNKTITFTKEDGTVLTASFRDNNEPQFPDDVLNTLTFNDNDDGVLRAITSEGSIIDASLDGRYSLLGHKHLWVDITDRPTKLSQFTNDLDNIEIPNLSDVLLEGNSANNLKITNLADGVDGGDAVNKSQLDALESPFEIVDVTQQVYSDIAIVVKDFDNIANGMTYQEGAIDFGVSRSSIHEMGLYSFKAGFNSTASGAASSAFGDGVVASGMASSAFGGHTIASGDYSSAFGTYTTASGAASSAFGDGVVASGNGSSAFGDGVVASGNRSSAFGYNTIASGGSSSAFGQSAVSNEFASLAIGMNSTNGAAQTSWTNGSPIFKVGNGTSVNARKNAYTLYNDGRSEQEKDMEVTEIGQGFVMKSPDGTRWRITVEDDGSLITTELN